MIGDSGWPCQMGFVVPDIEAAMEHWIRALGAGPFIYVSQIVGTRFLYRDEPTQLDMAVALGYLGDTQIELIQQHNDAASPYRDFLASGRTGVQHIGFWSIDPLAAGERLLMQSYRRVFVGELPGAKLGSVYYEPAGGASPMIEVSEGTPAKRSAYDRLRKMTNEWDGEQPIRSYHSFGDFLADTGRL